jgi:hypothetical protein
MYVELPPESKLYGDSAYTEYELEELFKETELIDLQISRKANSKRLDKPWQGFIKTTRRKRIETTISEIVDMAPHSIHAVTSRGGAIKISTLCFYLSIKNYYLIGNLG